MREREKKKGGGGEELRDRGGGGGRHRGRRRTETQFIYLQNKIRLLIREEFPTHHNDRD